MSKSNVFDILFLIGRPAAGKSEIIDFLKKSLPETRVESFHIGEFHEIDDFPMIWSWFEEDAILARSGHPRLHTFDDGYFTHNYLWNVLIERLELDYWKIAGDRSGNERPEDQATGTAIVEFARGAEHGGFAEAFSHFSPEMLERGAVMYIDVPFEESLRKNRKRYNPKRAHSILEHGLPDEKLHTLYGESDWEKFSGDDQEYLHIGETGAAGTRVPYAVFPNADDVTSGANPELGPRLSKVLGELWERYRRE